MGHEIEQFTDGTAAFASANVEAWHALGTVLPGKLTAEQVMEYAYLGGWAVRKVPLYAKLTTLTDDGVTYEEVELKGKFGMARSHPKTGVAELLGESVNGVVGTDFDPFQNESMTEFLTAVSAESGAIFETAGSLRGGTDVFVTMRMPETMMIGGVDPVKLYIAIMDGKVGNRAITSTCGACRIMCANTQAVHLRTAQSVFKVRHTAKAGQRVQEAREALGLTFRYAGDFQAEADKMINATLSVDAFKKVCEEIWPTPPAAHSDASKTKHRNQRYELVHLFTDSDTNANIRGTRWAGYQAVTEYLDHKMPAGKPAVAAVNRALRTIDGSVIKKKEKAFALLRV